MFTRWTNCPRCNKVMPHGAICVNCPGKPVSAIPATAASVAPAIERCRLIEKDITVSFALLNSIWPDDGPNP